MLRALYLRFIMCLMESGSLHRVRWWYLQNSHDSWFTVASTQPCSSLRLAGCHPLTEGCWPMGADMKKFAAKASDYEAKDVEVTPAELKPIAQLHSCCNPLAAWQRKINEQPHVFRRARNISKKIKKSKRNSIRKAKKNQEIHPAGFLWWPLEPLF